MWSVVCGRRSMVFMVGAGSGRWLVFSFLLVGGRCLNQYMVGGRRLMVGGLWSLAGGRWFCTTPFQRILSYEILETIGPWD